MIDAADLKVELIYRQTGTTQSPGGQHAGVPVTDIRITHIPTGLIAQCGEMRSQHKNKQVALEMLEWGLISVKYQFSAKQKQNHD